MRTIDWVDGAVELIDQTRLPGELVTLRISDVPTLVEAIKQLAVRGAPALGVAGAFGVALTFLRHRTTGPGQRIEAALAGVVVLDGISSR